MSEVEMWRGKFGNEYTERNVELDIRPRYNLWSEILSRIDPPANTILEIGAGSGVNLRALHRLMQARGVPVSAVEPNAAARAMLDIMDIEAHDGTAAHPGRTADLVFTSGVLIHIPPDELLAACQGIYDAAERYIVCIEYFSAEPETKPYRGRHLWKRDFGDYWMENFDLQPLGCGFAWKRTTGLNNLTWWAFAK